MSGILKRYVIKNNIKKFVHEVIPIEGNKVRYTWTDNPNKALIFEDYPDYPSNSRVHEVLLKSYYKISSDGDRPLLIKTKAKPFLERDEFRTKKETIEAYLKKSQIQIEELEPALEKLKSDLEYAKENLIKEIDEEEENENAKLFKKFFDLCVGKIIKFTIFSWGQKYIYVLGRADEEDGNIIFYNSRGKKMLTVEKNTVGFIEKNQDKNYTIYIDPKQEQSFTIKLITLN